MVSDPVGLRKVHNLVAFERLLLILGVQSELPHRRATNKVSRRRLRGLVIKEAGLLEEDDRGGRSLHRRKRLRAVHYRLHVKGGRGVRCRREARGSDTASRQVTNMLK